MKIISVSELRTGTIVENKLLDSNGEVLVEKGVVISASMVNALKRRGISQVYIAQGDEEIQKILSKNITALESFSFDTEDDIDDGDEEDSDIPEVYEELKDLKDIKEGKEGLAQLLETPKIKSFEKNINNIDSIVDTPTDIPLIDNITELNVEDRTPEYKENISLNYEKALKITEQTLRKLRKGHNIKGEIIRGIVENFINTFVTDKNILLNISGINSKTEDYLFNHSLNVCLISINIAAASGYSKEQVIEIGIGALLHDIGMMLIPSSIRKKKGPLSQDDLYEIHKHPVLGLHLLEKILNIPESVSYVAYQSHEREHGGGYPKKRSGRFIHRYAKIVMIADMFEAMSSPRPYRNSFIPYDAMKELLVVVREGLINPNFLKFFIEYTSLFPVGSLVELNNEKIGKVIKANKTEYTKPVISIIGDNKGNIKEDKDIDQINLLEEKTIKITKALPNDDKISIMKGF